MMVSMALLILFNLMDNTELMPLELTLTGPERPLCIEPNYELK